MLSAPLLLVEALIERHSRALGGSATLLALVVECVEE
jgi:hypothetical protein